MTAAFHKHAAMPWRLPVRRARQWGQGLLAASCAGMGVAELSTLKLLPELHPYGDIPTSVIALGGIAQLVCALLLIFPKLTRPAAAALSLLWFIAFVATATNAAGAASALPAWVPVLESAVLFVGFLGLALVQPTSATRSNIALRLAFGAMLVLFGLIHIIYRAAIAGMIPAWIPLGSLWPLMTGGLMLLAGFAMLVDRLKNLAAISIAALFASWIILVHPVRIRSDPGSIAEWEFALTALALTGAALMVAGNSLGANGAAASAKADRRTGT